MLRISLCLMMLWGIVCSMQPPGTGATTVVFVNCAETAAGTAGPVLTAAGREQAAQLTLFLRDMPVSAVYTPYSSCLMQTVQPLADARDFKVQYFRDACENNPEVMEHILEEMMKRHKGKTIVICAPAQSILKMATMLGIREKELKPGMGLFEEVLIVNVFDVGEAVAQKLNMNFQKKV